jgi:hypothetical protein
MLFLFYHILQIQRERERERERERSMYSFAYIGQKMDGIRSPRVGSRESCKLGAPNRN